MVHWWAILTIQDTVKNLKLKWDYVHTPILGCFMHRQVDAYEDFWIKNRKNNQKLTFMFTIGSSRRCLTELQYQQKSFSI
jgi:hypothetical protein